MAEPKPSSTSAGHTEHHDNHGQTPAAWTAVFVIMVGFLVGSIAFLVAQPWLFWVGIVIIVLGAVTGKVMQMMGMGKPLESADDPHAAR